MPSLEQDFSSCRTLLVGDGNLLDDSVESSGYRALLQALDDLGMPCEAVGRFVVAAAQETEPSAWLASRGWRPEAESTANAPRVGAGGVPVTLLRGHSAQPHPTNDAERAAFLKLVNATLDQRRPDVVLALPGPTQADVLAAARARSLSTVAVQPDATQRDARPFRDADVVLAPTRFAADYLRDSLGLPCASLPPPIDVGEVPAPREGGAVMFDSAAPENGLTVFMQIAEELGRRRPNLPMVSLGGTGDFTFPKGGKIECHPRRELGADWAGVRVFLAPLVGWERTPTAALSALAHGVPVVLSDRGALADVLAGAGLVLPLPDRLTVPVVSPLKPAEIAPWVETVLRLYDDRAFHVSQHGLARLAGRRWAADELAGQYAQFLSNLVRRRAGTVVGPAPSRNGSGAALRKLAEAHAWPEQQPEDAAPGQEQGWLGGGTEHMLARALSPSTHLVVELGAWLGLSTRYIADRAPAATVVSVDHWQGSPEHHKGERYQKLLPRLYETFQSRCWDYRQRVVPLRMDSLAGLRAVAEAGLQPDFIYVDAEHTFEAVSAELALARQLFPRAGLGGDDYDWGGVREAVNGFARRQGLIVDRIGHRGWRLLENWAAADAGRPPARGQWTVLVPHLSGIEWECEQGLRQLEDAGVKVVRRGGCSAIDVARNELLSGALHDGAESILFIDSDLGFEPQDALRLLARPEPVVSAVYPKKGVRQLASVFADGVKEVLFGPEATGLYPLKYAATGFLRLRAGVLRRMIAELGLPLCNTHWGKGIWPFFLPLIVPHGPGKMHYLGEDWSFSHRLGQIGVTPLADTSIRLWHWGRYGFGWEDAGSSVNRFRTYNYQLSAT